MIARIPKRVVARPDPAAWGEDELMTPEEAVALLWPNGPLTASSLRTAYKAGRLEMTAVARKLLVTRRQLAAMTEASRVRRAGPAAAGANGAAPPPPAKDS